MKEIGHEQPFKEEEETTGGRRGDEPRGGNGINKAKGAVICRLCSQISSWIGSKSMTFDILYIAHSHPHHRESVCARKACFLPKTPAFLSLGTKRS